MIVSSILAWIVFVHEFWHWTKLYVIARSIKCDDRKSVSLLVSHSSVLHAFVPAVCNNLHM